MPGRSIDWNSVQLLSSTLFLEETAYAEGLTAWALQKLGRPGIVGLEKDKLTFLARPGQSGQPGQTTVGLSECQAILPHGGFADIQQLGGAAPLGCTVDGALPAKQLYLYLARKTQKIGIPPNTPANPSEIPFLNVGYELVAAASDNRRSALPIARLNKNLDGFVEDTEFIPDCLYLHSHWLLREKVLRVQFLADSCLQKSRECNILEEHRLKLLVSTLIPITRILNWETPPRAFLERCTHMLMAHLEILPRLDTRVPQLKKQVEQLGVGRPLGHDTSIDLFYFMQNVIAALEGLNDFYGARGRQAG